jgi:hypothetical protein
MKKKVMSMKETGIGLITIQQLSLSGAVVNQTTTTETTSPREKTVCASGMDLDGMIGGATN